MNPLSQLPDPDPAREQFKADYSEGRETGLYLALLELIDEGLVIASDERILEVNSAACRLLERDYRQLTGQPLESLFPTAQAFLDARARLFIQGEMRGSVQVALPGGRSRYLRFVAAARLRPGLHALILSEDVLADTAPPERDSIWPRLAAAVDQPVLVLDEQALIVASNRPAQRLLGAVPADLKRRPVSAFVSMSEHDANHVTLVCRHGGQQVPARRLNGPRPGWQILIVTATALPQAPEEVRYQKIFGQLPLPTLVCHPLSLRIIDANAAAETLYLHARAELLGMTLPQLWASADADPGELLGKGGVWSLRRSDATSFTTEVLTFPLEHGATPGPLVVVHDLPDTPLLSSRLRLPLDVFEYSPQAILVCAADTRILSVNRAFCTITGYAEDEVIGRTPRLLSSGQHDAGFYADMWCELATHGKWEGEIWNRRKDGEVFPEWLSIAAVPSASGEVLHYIGVFSDLSQRRQAEARAQYLASHDALTGLPNMQQFEAVFDEALQRARLNRRNLGVIKIDLNAFRDINHRYGNAVGDRLLQEVATRLRHTLPRDVLLARKRSDAFLALIPDANLISDVTRCGEQLVAAFSRAFTIDEHTVQLDAAIGAALFPEDGQDLGQLMRNASTATRAARQPGSSTFQLFAADFDAGEAETRLLAATITHACNNTELRLYFQPVWDLQEQRVVAAEALLRWQHPELGLLPFARFAEAARQAGQLAGLEHWVLSEACSAARHWASDITVVVNLSSECCLHADCTALVAAALTHSSLPAHRLELDLDQALLTTHPGIAQQRCNALAQLGVRIAIDDFGCAPADLTTLARLPLQRLKLERTLVHRASQGEDASLLLEMTLAMAGPLGVEVLAKGVESAAESSFLAALGCHLQQGIHFGPPAPAASLFVTD